MKVKIVKSAVVVFGVALLSVAVAWMTVHLVGCGAMDGPDDPGDALWTVKGKIVSIPEEIDPQNLRAAFVWEKEPREGGVVLIGQDVPVSPEFPSKFTLELFDLPPEEAMSPGEELEEELAGMRVATGRLTVYDDKNGNEQLDVLPREATQFIDYVLGPKEDYLALFIEGDPSAIKEMDGVKVEIKAGLNLFRDRSEEDISPPYDQLDPMQELIITLLDDPEKQSLMCQEPPWSSSAGGRIIEVDYKTIPEDKVIVCSEDGYSLRVDVLVSRTQECICCEIEESWETWIAEIPTDQPVPEGWPCQIP